MVQEAEKYAEEDGKQKERIEAKNSLESYVFNMKTSVEDEKVSGGPFLTCITGWIVFFVAGGDVSYD